jgi:2-methylcitrate dehydratase PrpD
VPYAGADLGGDRLRSGACDELARWAGSVDPTDHDLELAGRALRDTVAVLLAARGGTADRILEPLSEAGRWAALAHVLDFDDLHLPSTAHLSAVCVPVALAQGGGARAYLAGAGVMARLGVALGWRHYAAGWHATCTAGAPAAAAAAAVARGLDPAGIATAMALAVPAAGGMQRAFGTSAKSLQVAFAVEAGIRAAALAQAGADADPRALDDWLELVGGDPTALPDATEAIPGGLAIKVYPCCYALQRPMAAVKALGPVDVDRVRGIRVRTPASSLQPLIHDRPVSGLEAKFSLQYGLACALLDDPVSLASFGDEAVSRPEARRLMELVEVEASGPGDGLLAGEVAIEVMLDGGSVLRSTLELPPGAPSRPPNEAELRQKIDTCAGSLAEDVRGLDWPIAADFLRIALASNS